MKKTSLMSLVVLYFTAGTIFAMDVTSKTKFDSQLFKQSVENARSLEDIKKLMNGSLDKGGVLEFDFKKGFYQKKGNENDITKKRLEVLNTCFASELKAALNSPQSDLVLKKIKAKYPIKDSAFHPIEHVFKHFYDPQHLPVTYDQAQFNQLVADFKTFVGIVPVVPKVVDVEMPTYQFNSKNVLVVGCISACVVAALYGTYKLYLSRVSNQDIDAQDEEINDTQVDA